MPEGKTHLKIELLSALLIFPCVIYLAYTFKEVTQIEAISFCIGYLLGSLLLSPDMDLFKSDAIGRWSILKYIWAPYCWLYNHRGASHSWIFGTLTRFLYLLLLLSPIIYFYPQILNYWREVISVFVGCWFANSLHLIADRHWKL